MSAVCIEVDRLQVSLYGVSATVAEDFSTQIGRALDKRLSGLPAGTVTAALDLGLLELGRIDLKDSPDAGALADIVADCFVETVAMHCRRKRNDNGGGNT